jgi:hypothetical protein
MNEGFPAQIAHLWHEGLVRHVVVKNNVGESKLDLPLLVVIIGAAVAPWLLAIGVVVAVMTNHSMSVERRPPNDDNDSVAAAPGDGSPEGAALAMIDEGGPALAQQGGESAAKGGVG